MRKEIVLPAATVAVGAAGFLLRRWELATAFEPDTGLHIPGSPATWALIALSAALAAALVLLCRGKYPDFAGGYDQAFQAKGNTLYATAMILSAFLLLAAALCAGWAFVSGQNRVMTRMLLAVMCAASFFCVLSTAKNNYRAEGRGKYSFTLLMPAYTCCVWLIAAYQSRAADPVILDYLYELLAIIAALLGLYFTAGFSFERSKVFRASFFSLLAVYFSFVTLADGHDLATLLLYAFVIVYLLSSTAVLLYNCARPGEPQQNADFHTEVKPDEQQ
uniref:hypothetical protein n=1 Tax=Dysosmobacter welbionis TaxID=2093857 RepID=UPI003FEE5004